MNVTEAGATVKVNRVTTGWTWNIAVNATGSSLEEVVQAKEVALQVAYQLRDELAPAAIDPSKEEVPF